MHKINLDLIVLLKSGSVFDLSAVSGTPVAHGVLHGCEMGAQDREELPHRHHIGRRSARARHGDAAQRLADLRLRVGGRLLLPGVRHPGVVRLLRLPRLQHAVRPSKDLSG